MSNYQNSTDLQIENNLSHVTIDCAIKVHKALGPGLLESAYKECLAFELSQEGFDVKREVAMPLVYKNITMDCGYRIDLLIEKKLIIEVKSVEALNDVYIAQVLTYLKLSGCRLGLLINFNVALLKNGIKRLIL